MQSDYKPVVKMFFGSHSVNKYRCCSDYELLPVHEVFAHNSKLGLPSVQGVGKFGN